MKDIQLDAQELKAYTLALCECLEQYKLDEIKTCMDGCMTICIKRNSAVIKSLETSEKEKENEISNEARRAVTKEELVKKNKYEA